MPLTISWEQIALRLGLACVASLLVGLNRDENGHTAGMRTTMLVCVAATLSMLQVNLLVLLSGKPSSSFIQLDLMRLPLGILSGIGFIGAGVIIKREQTVTGVTTAATMWYVTVLGLLFGGGQLVLGCAGTALAVCVLWGLKKVEAMIPREHQGSVALLLAPDAPAENELRQQFFQAGCEITKWKPTYQPAGVLSALECDLQWRERASRVPHTPASISHLRTLSGVLSVTWEEERP